MQPVAELAVLHVTDKAVDAGDRLGRAFGSVKPEIQVESDRLRFVPDVVLQTVAATWVQPVGIGKLVQQRLESHKIARRLALCGRRRQMAECHGANPALGLGRLARVVDDERINDRDRSNQCLRPALVRERHRLARQPFQRAMGTNMDQCIYAGDLLQPKIECDVSVARHPRQIVVLVVAPLPLTPLGLKGNADPPTPNGPELKRFVSNGGIFLGLAPGCLKVRDKAIRQLSQGSLVIRDGPANRISGQCRLQPVPRSDCIAFGVEVIHDCLNRSKRIQADRMRRSPSLARIGRKHDGN